MRMNMGGFGESQGMCATFDGEGAYQSFYLLGIRLHGTIPRGGMCQF